MMKMKMKMMPKMMMMKTVKWAFVSVGRVYRIRVEIEDIELNYG